MKAWKDSATLILAACHGRNYNYGGSPAIHNYKLLSLKRHQKSSFMPGTYVFPGGVQEPADCDLKWYELFASFGYDRSNLASLIPKSTTRPQIFKSRPNELPREIALRITAIRETFEECGLLMCRQKKNGSEPSSSWAYNVLIPKNELQTWQKKVHNDAKVFFKLCEEFKCYPDLWALHEWNNWLTPSYMPKRFDVMFYLTCMPFIPYAEYEAIEMEDLKWETPQNLLSSSKDMILPPPQHYEITRVADFKDISNLLDFAVKHSREGLQQLYLPVSMHLKDCTAHILPGDTLYPKKVELLEVQIIDKSDITLDEFQKMTPRNRIIFLNMQIIVARSDKIQAINSHVGCAIHQLENWEMNNKL